MTTTVCVYEDRYDMTTSYDDDGSGSGGLNCLIHGIRTVGFPGMVLHGCLCFMGGCYPFCIVCGRPVCSRGGLVPPLHLYVWRFMSVISPYHSLHGGSWKTDIDGRDHTSSFLLFIHGAVRLRRDCNYC
jgi:hypothetical protein